MSPPLTDPVDSVTKWHCPKVVGCAGDHRCPGLRSGRRCGHSRPSEGVRIAPERRGHPLRKSVPGPAAPLAGGASEATWRGPDPPSRPHRPAANRWSAWGVSYPTSPEPTPNLVWSLRRTGQGRVDDTVFSDPRPSSDGGQPCSPGLSLEVGLSETSGPSVYHQPARSDPSLSRKAQPWQASNRYDSPRFDEGACRRDEGRWVHRSNGAR
jgi:hypothetical protein